MTVQIPDIMKKYRGIQNRRSKTSVFVDEITDLYKASNELDRTRLIILLASDVSIFEGFLNSFAEKEEREYQSQDRGGY